MLALIPSSVISSNRVRFDRLPEENTSKSKNNSRNIVGSSLDKLGGASNPEFS